MGRLETESAVKVLARPKALVATTAYRGDSEVPASLRGRRRHS
jgi:hypothetical protein